MWRHLREGKRMWSETLHIEGVGTAARPARRIFRLTERTIDMASVAYGRECTDG